MCIQRIVSFFSLLSPLAWFTWLTYTMILPLCALLGWLVLPFTFLLMWIVNVFGFFQLWKASYNHIMDKPRLDNTFVSTREALKTVFPKASKKEIKRYEHQINEAEELDPILVISPDINWINQYSQQAYWLVMDSFATEDLPAGTRRDDGSRCVFHFRNGREMRDVRDAIQARIPNAFCIPPSLQANHPHGQMFPVGNAWVITRVGVRDSDFWEENNFFHTN
ncbi:hypothetical protein C1645_745054 [Glomus cerebriforme]|uniref:Uncharacterized protein n=1 Tax=Glomus cerebriforme TaxID=658196 RepID=A0A397S2S5_9GLOM|nr:hypothetical protein C1645_745054 [Glomus cerebriforme]